MRDRRSASFHFLALTVAFSYLAISVGLQDRTISTEQGAWIATASDTDPSMNLFTLP